MGSIRVPDYFEEWEGMKIRQKVCEFWQSVSYDFLAETEQRMLHSSTSSEILLIKNVFIRLSAGKMANSA